MAYIEENIRKRRGERGEQVEEEQVPKPFDPQEELYHLPEKFKNQAPQKVQEEGSVTNSVSMLTAIPEVDLGMEYVSVRFKQCFGPTYISSILRV